MSKRFLLAGASALMLSLAVPGVSMAQSATDFVMPYSVSAVQRTLNDLGYSAGSADGRMGSKTRAAIRAYQTDKGLPTSGEPSRSLYDHMQKTVMAATPQSPAVGVERSELVEIQTRLRNRGYTVSDVSGSFDSATEAAIRSYQRDADLQITGHASVSLLEQLRLGNNSGTNGALVRSEVVRLQTALNERGYSAGPADGVTGPRVRAAIRSYQADADLPATGEATRSLLAKLEASDDTGASVGRDDSDRGGESGHRSTGRQIDRELQRHGYYVGDANGANDTQRWATIRSYQRDASLPVTGEANPALLYHLKSSSVHNRGETNSLLVWEIEKELARRNYKTGPVDGSMDRETTAAIRQYEKDAGRAVTGAPSADLFASIEAADTKNISRRDIREIETLLNRRGYSIGNINGVADAQTTAAIKAYQEDAGLVITGRPSAALLQHLKGSNILSRN